MVWLIVGGILLLLIIVAIVMYNGLVKANVRTDEAWSDINVQLKRRYDLIPNLVDTVKAYAKHESSVFEKITQARAQAINAQGQGVAETAQAENAFQDTLKSLFAVAESYPDLKANQNFQHLQAELVDTEDKIQASRRFYNGAARDLNIKIQSFPGNIFASIFKFKKRVFFEVDESEAAAIAKPTAVNFS